MKPRGTCEVGISRCDGLFDGTVRVGVARLRAGRSFTQACRAVRRVCPGHPTLPPEPPDGEGLRLLAGLNKPATCYTLHHFFAARLLAAGYDIRTVQELLRHKDVSTTMIYTQVVNLGPSAVQSPPDLLFSALGSQAPQPNVRRPSSPRSPVDELQMVLAAALHSSTPLTGTTEPATWFH